MQPMNSFHLYGTGNALHLAEWSGATDVNLETSGGGWDGESVGIHIQISHELRIVFHRNQDAGARERWCSSVHEPKRNWNEIFVNKMQFYFSTAARIQRIRPPAMQFTYRMLIHKKRGEKPSDGVSLHTITPTLRTQRAGEGSAIGECKF